MWLSLEGTVCCRQLIWLKRGGESLASMSDTRAVHVVQRRRCLFRDFPGQVRT